LREVLEKFPARFALGISRRVASRPMMAIPTLDNPRTTEPPVKATIETKKMSTRTTNALRPTQFATPGFWDPHHPR